MKEVDLTDYQLAHFLKKNNALDKCESHLNTVIWRNEQTTEVVCICIYDNAKCTTRMFVDNQS